ncbi:L-2-hydroxyglutarate oxidase [Roseiconus nitratireducens]|uniref:L-2-hydroxyglutarate oxidase n=1 Tax=Roseiconus nitratireducens TaxID=2605748 RepID=A0A5M6DI02_9BACT|nr:L-2-hydroxyglutarate oxidase [Roseiconus nitratireducens]KAA5547174.1 L-2-hydroxyglutarate oxidase [Roseiconus nitratireducens]
MATENFHSDFLVIGGGIIGLATAWKLQRRFPDCTVAVLEAEREVAHHQSGRNSGVIHSGIYYKPGSQKALTCRDGKTQLEAFCQQYNVPWERCGKVVVATSESELQSLDAIAQRGTQNGVAMERLDSDQLRQREPAAAGIAALLVPETGIVDYPQVCRQLAEQINRGRGVVRLDSRAVAIKIKSESVRVTDTRNRTHDAGLLINCGGLHSDQICRLCGLAPGVRIVPFRGEYYELKPERENLVRHLIYPVPDPSFPFLGVHFTRMIGGGVECGPNAVLALAREGYGWSKINVSELWGTLRYAGFRRLARKHWRMGLGEMHRSLSKSAFVTALQKLLPSVTTDDLVRGRAGVRAQAVASDGRLVDDFLVHKAEAAIHVLNAPSPAATASLAIADAILDRIGTS